MKTLSLEPLKASELGAALQRFLARARDTVQGQRVTSHIRVAPARIVRLGVAARPAGQWCEHISRPDEKTKLRRISTCSQSSAVMADWQFCPVCGAPRPA